MVCSQKRKVVLHNKIGVHNFGSDYWVIDFIGCCTSKKTIHFASVFHWFFHSFVMQSFAVLFYISKAHMMACNVSFVWNTVKSILVAISFCNWIRTFPLSFIHAFVSNSTLRSCFLHSSVFFGLSISFFFLQLFGRFYFLL